MGRWDAPQPAAAAPAAAPFSHTGLRPAGGRKVGGGRAAALAKLGGAKGWETTSHASVSAHDKPFNKCPPFRPCPSARAPAHTRPDACMRTADHDWIMCGATQVQRRKRRTL